MTVVGDVAQRKLRDANERIQEQRQELAQKNEQLNQEIMERGRLIEDLEAFAHTVAHDLKNPLSVVVGYSSLALSFLRDRGDLKGQEMIEPILLTGERMGHIIQELLTFASVRQQDVTARPIDMSVVVAEVESRLDQMIQEYAAEIVKPDAWPSALGYAPWIEEVWANYISNALKYGGSPPHVQLGFDHLPPEPQTPHAPAHIRFWVRDNGAGLSPEVQARLFTKFSRFDQARVSGHGLGLSIVKRIAEKLGGQVGVQSVPGEGSLFFFTLPTYPPDQVGFSQKDW
jgi:signal transduction histidine kinase